MRPGDLAAAFERCRSEALQAFGNGELYVEQLLPHARHVEVQIMGDGTEVAHLWDRECSAQRQHQKLIETAPAFGLTSDMRARLLELSVALGNAVNYRGLGTIEFLIDQDAGGALPFAFIEANPRLQVEHTVTEAITGLDLVRIQLQLAAGATLAKLGLRQFAIAPPRGVAIEARVNLEVMNADGTARPTGGTLLLYEPASGPGIRVDGFAYAGYRTNGKFDSLLAKTIAYTADGDRVAAARKAERALSEFRIAGVSTNISFLRALLRTPEFAAGDVHTRFIEENAASLCAQAAELSPPEKPKRQAGAKLESADPLAVLEHGKSDSGFTAPVPAPAPSERAARFHGFGRNERNPGAFAGNHHPHCRRTGGDGARGRHSVDHGVHENGTCHQCTGGRGDSRHHGIAGRHRARGSRAGICRVRRHRGNRKVGGAYHRS